MGSIIVKRAVDVDLRQMGIGLQHGRDGAILLPGQHDGTNRHTGAADDWFAALDPRNADDARNRLTARDGHHVAFFDNSQASENGLLPDDSVGNPQFIPSPLSAAVIGSA